VDCDTRGGGRLGGLALIWHNDVNLHIIAYNKMLIDFYVLDPLNNENWNSTGMYGFPCQSQKHLTCDTIINLFNSKQVEKWILFGDFNLHLNSSEKQGGNHTEQNLCTLFQETLNHYGLFDLRYHGNKFTWANNQECSNHIKERLDKYCVSESWINQFPRYTNYHLLRYSYDHSPILLEFWDKSECRGHRFKRQKIQRFEEVWSHDKESFHIVKNIWTMTNGDSTAKIQATLHYLSRWGKSQFGDLPNKINHIQTHLGLLKDQIPSKDIISQIKSVEKDLSNILMQEEVWWAHIAKMQWLEHGDSNTKFFHFNANQRRKKNTIYAIQDNQGLTWNDEIHIHNTFISHFSDIFSTSNPINVPDAFDVIRNRVPDDMKNELGAEFSA